MTIRVDSAQPRRQGGWEWSIKGYQGRGVYVRLVTDADGRGLYVFDENALTFGEPLLGDTFFVLPTASKALAIQLLEQALVELGWGPVVHERRTRFSLHPRY